MKMQHSASILCILSVCFKVDATKSSRDQTASNFFFTPFRYLDNKVFVSLANGEVIVYQREAGTRGVTLCHCSQNQTKQKLKLRSGYSSGQRLSAGRWHSLALARGSLIHTLRGSNSIVCSFTCPGSFWDPQSSQTLVLGSPSSPVTKMVPVGGKLWCGSQNRVLVINTATLAQEVTGALDTLLSPIPTPPPLTPPSPPQHWFQVGADSSRCVTCMVAYGQGVWLALQGSAHVRLYHAQSCDSLTEVDVAPAVHKMLAGDRPSSPFFLPPKWAASFPGVQSL